jgi:hypothetical protein
VLLTAVKHAVWQVHALAAVHGNSNHPFLTSLVCSPGTAPYAINCPDPASAADCEALDTNGDGLLDMKDDMYSPYWPGDEWVDWVGMSVFHISQVGRKPEYWQPAACDCCVGMCGCPHVCLMSGCPHVCLAYQSGGIACCWQPAVCTAAGSLLSVLLLAACCLYCCWQPAVCSATLVVGGLGGHVCPPFTAHQPVGIT